jgi:hypothetical protein
MAELTTLESKLAEVIGLAMAAQGATDKVKKLVEGEDRELARTLERMHSEAAETEARSTELAGTFDGKKTAILDKARETKTEATEMMKTYLGSDGDALDGFEFLTMAEAGEVAHWAILGRMNERARHPGLDGLVDWATPIQERHFQFTRQGALKLAAEEDPNALA